MKGALSGETKTFAKVVAGHEAAHVAALKGALGFAAVAKPKFDFNGTTENQAKFQATAEVLEYTGVSAYLGQVGNITSKKVLGAAGSILPVEAWHAAWIADLRRHGGKPSLHRWPSPPARPWRRSSRRSKAPASSSARPVASGRRLVPVARYHLQTRISRARHTS